MKKRFTFFLIGTLMFSTLLPMLIFHSSNTISNTVVGEGRITVDTTWNASGSPYFIEGNVTVDYGVNLTIEPGVEVRFNGYYCLYIEGNLSALGNDSNLIRFASNNSLYWDRVQINSTGHAEIHYCNIISGNYGVFVEHSSGNKINNNIISDNLNHGVFLNASSENYIENNQMSNNLDGVHLYKSSNNTIFNNNITNHINYAVFLGESQVNDVQGNNLSDNYEGVHLYKSSFTTILDNDIQNSFRGIYLYFSDSNVIRYNLVYQNDGNGIEVYYSDDNEIANNNISFNGYIGNYNGINLSESHNNRIFHNTLIDNAIQAFDDESDNDWDWGYINGGNYWSDYTGEDLKRGEKQDVPGSDGIGDDPYIIDFDSVDHFPLMNQTLNIAPLIIKLNSPMNNTVVKEGAIIDLDILIQNARVNYSINWGGNISLFEPFNITVSTATGWVEGYNHLDVFVNDTTGNVNSSWFSFILDSIKPIIVLNSPLNNSLIKGGEIINMSILDTNFKSAYYYINSGPIQSLLFPHDIDTSSWPNNIYNIEIQAEDIAGNINSTLYVFTVDSTAPMILLNFPANNSCIKPGVLINISISDEYLNLSSINYYINGNGPQTFANPYYIETTTWPDDIYYIEVRAADTPGNINFTFFNITIDSLPPSIILNHPENNSIIKAGVPINFSVFDANPFTFKYSLDNMSYYNLTSPYNINTSTWFDMIYTVDVNVTDFAGNFNLSWYNFTIDSFEPKITLVSPLNNSFISAGTEIFFNVSDPNLSFVNYSVNSGEYLSLTPLYRINTTDWSDGVYDIKVIALDKVGHNKSANFSFNVDSTPPLVVNTFPKQHAKDISVKTAIKIEFNELMGTPTLKYATSISPSINFTLYWDKNNLSMIIVPKSNLANATEYTIVITTSAKDLAGNALTEDYVLIFTTETGKEEEDLLWLIFIAIIVIIIVLIIILALMYRRAKGISGEEEEEEDELKEGEEEKAKPREEGGAGEEIEGDELKTLEKEIPTQEPQDKPEDNIIIDEKGIKEE